MLFSNVWFQYRNPTAGILDNFNIVKSNQMNCNIEQSVTNFKSEHVAKRNKIHLESFNIKITCPQNVVAWLNEMET